MYGVSYVYIRYWDDLVRYNTEYRTEVCAKSNRATHKARFRFCTQS